MKKNYFNHKKLYKIYDKSILEYISRKGRQLKADVAIHTYFISILIIIISLFCNFPSFAQKNTFPSWMDEVNFEKTSSSQGFNGPVDPETGKTSVLEPKRGKGFKPKLPDFAELRKKATKVETETGSDTVIIQKKESNSTVKNTKNATELDIVIPPVIGEINKLASDTVASFPKIISEEEPSDEELRRQRTYRPGRIKSFYLESKQKQKEETNK